MKAIFFGLAIAAALPAAASAAEPAAPEPASVSNDADAERLRLARETVEFIWPLGTYQRMMSGTMDRMFGAMFDMKLGDIVPPGKEMSEEDRKIADTTMREAIAGKDPHFEERMRITGKVITAEMGAVMSKVEPAMRDGLAAAYAKKFSAAQLQDLNSFFATPTGRFYASESMMLFMDPELMKRMMGAVPEMMKAMPAIEEKVKKATAHLPPPPAPKQSDEEAKTEDPKA